MNDIPLLSLILLVPLAGAALVWLRPGLAWARAAALAASATTLVLGVLAVGLLGDGAGFRLVEQAAWMPDLRVHYRVGVDGLSAPFLPATALLFCAVILASWKETRRLPALYFSLLLLQLSATLGVFVALDTILFFFFWELTLVPLYFLVSLWGVGEHRRYAATKYTLVMLAGGIPLLLGFVLLAFHYAAHTGQPVPAGLSFDLAALLAAPPPRATALAVFLLLLAGFAVKTPLFPLHTWLPVSVMEGPAAVAALLLGLKLGAYGLLRFALPLSPAVAREWHWALAGLGVIGVLYGAIAALAQTNLRRMLAYASLSHVGLVVLGLASFNVRGLQGAVFQLLNFTVAAGGITLLIGFLHARTGSTDFAGLGGIHRAAPLWSALLLFFSLAGLGMPGTSGFPAELLILVSALETHTGAGLAALAGAVLAAAYTLGGYRKAVLGPVSRAEHEALPDLTRRELAVALGLAAPILVFGLYPAPLLDLMAPDAAAWVARLKP